MVCSRVVRGTGRRTGLVKYKTNRLAVSFPFFSGQLLGTNVTSTVRMGATSPPDTCPLGQISLIKVFTQLCLVHLRVVHQLQKCVGRFTIVSFGANV